MLSQNCDHLSELHYRSNGKKLHFYRRHDNNITTEAGEKVGIKLIWRVNLIVNLVIRYFKIKLNKSIR